MRSTNYMRSINCEKHIPSELNSDQCEVCGLFISCNIEFSIGPNNKQSHDTIINWLLLNSFEIKDISHEGDHFSEIYCVGDYNKAQEFCTSIKGTSIEHWEE